MNDVIEMQGPGPSSSGRLDQFLAGLMLRRNATGVADERERHVGHEAAAFGYVMQTFTVPWATAIAVWVFGRPAIPALLMVFAAYYVAELARMAYQMRQGVRLLGDGGYAWWKKYKMSAASWLYLTQLHVSTFVILSGTAYAYREELWSLSTSSGTYAAIGGAASVMGFAPAMIFLYFRWSQRKNAVESD